MYVEGRRNWNWKMAPVCFFRTLFGSPQKELDIFNMIILSLDILKVTSRMIFRRPCTLFYVGIVLYGLQSSFSKTFLLFPFNPHNLILKLRLIFLFSKQEQSCWAAKSCPTDSLRSHELQHARLLCTSLSPWAWSNSCQLSQWCHPTVSSSVTTLSSCPQSFSATGSFPVSQLFASDGQSIEVSASASVLPMNIWGWFPLGLTGLISLLSKRFLRVFSSTTIQKFLFWETQPSLWSKNRFERMILGWDSCSAVSSNLPGH